MATNVSFEGGSLVVQRLLEGFVDRILAEDPGLPATTVRSSCMALTDAVILWELLGASDVPVEVVDVGSFLGVSTFLFASHPAVRQATSVDRRSATTGGLGEDPGKLATVVRSVLTGDPEAAAKMRFLDQAGEAGTGGSEASPVDLTGPAPDDEATFLVFADGDRSSAQVFADLEFLVAALPDSLIIVNGCRHHSGPFVQAGVARFLESRPDEYDFRLLADLSPGLRASNLGAVNRSRSDGALPEWLSRLVGSLSTRLDPLRQLEREQELIARIAAYRRQLAEAEYAVQSLHRSISWRLTTPLRRLNRRSRHAVGRGVDTAE